MIEQDLSEVMKEARSTAVEFGEITSRMLRQVATLPPDQLMAWLEYFNDCGAIDALDNLSSAVEDILIVHGDPRIRKIIGVMRA